MASMTLSEDAMMGILLRLPVISLFRLRCVCKSWCALIKSSNFIAMHSDVATSLKKNDSILIKRYLQPDSKSVLSVFSGESLGSGVPQDIIDVPFFKDEYLVLFGPCNGIFCVTDNGDIALWNPSIREFKTLPAPSFTYRRGLKSLTECVGFGFDPITKDYKVVRMVEIFEDDDYYHYECTKAQIYNLSTDSWREINAVVPDISHFHCFEPFFNGSFHWSANYFVGDDDSVDDKDFILSFHMSTEVFQKMGFPYVCSIGDGKDRSLGVLNESLALILYDYSVAESKNFDIWVMTEYGVSESWTKQFTIGPLSGVHCPLSIWKNNEVLLEASNGQLVSCDLKTQDIKAYEIYGVQTTLRVLIYNESLVSINRGSGLGHSEEK